MQAHFQKDQPLAVAVVTDKDDNYTCFRLTQAGLAMVQKCEDTAYFHPHPELEPDDIYCKVDVFVATSGKFAKAQIYVETDAAVANGDQIRQTIAAITRSASDRFQTPPTPEPSTAPQTAPTDCQSSVVAIVAQETTGRDYTSHSQKAFQTAVTAICHAIGQSSQPDAITSIWKATLEQTLHALTNTSRCLMDVLHDAGFDGTTFGETAPNLISLMQLVTQGQAALVARATLLKEYRKRQLKEVDTAKTEERLLKKACTLWLGRDYGSEKQQRQRKKGQSDGPITDTVAGDQTDATDPSAGVMVPWVPVQQPPESEDPDAVIVAPRRTKRAQCIRIHKRLEVLDHLDSLPDHLPMLKRCNMTCAKFPETLEPASCYRQVFRWKKQATKFCWRDMPEWMQRQCSEPPDWWKAARGLELPQKGRKLSWSLPEELYQAFDRLIVARAQGSGASKLAEPVSIKDIVSTMKDVIKTYEKNIQPLKEEWCATRDRVLKGLQDGTMTADDAMAAWTPPPPPANLKPTYAWAKRYRQRNHWKDHALNTAGAFLAYDDPQMVCYRAKWQAQNARDKVHLELQLNYDQLWKQSVRPKKRKLVKATADLNRRSAAKDARYFPKRKFAKVAKEDAVSLKKRRRCQHILFFMMYFSIHINVFIYRYIV